MSSDQPDQSLKAEAEREREQLAEFAETLAAYREALIAKGFKRGEAQQLCLHYQELRFMPVVPVVEAPSPDG